MIPIQPTLTLSPTAPWISAPVNGPADGANLYLCVTSLTSGQSVSLRIIAYDVFGNAYFYGPARTALSAAGQYIYSIKGDSASTGGAIPSDGILNLPIPENYAVELVFGDTSGTKAITFSLAA